MINYLAEQIDMAETTSSQETKRKCFETIIKLWESRSSFPNGARPFESLEPVFSVLDSLNTESSIPRYYINRVPEKNWSQEDESVIKRLEMIKMLDSNARVLISFLLEQAVDEAVTDEAREWIDAVSGIERVPEIDFLVRFYGEKIDPKKDKAEKLQKRIEELKAFEEMSRTVRQNLENLVHSDFFGNK